ncbi:carbonic anhydrase 1 isoform X1 [Megalopta genalis]|uniref:carbonic anhydrase 1 isoform X1 n=1 Tax=Megalopta genalis TaxID=115081 RepID=UPI003FD456C8
MTVLIFAFTAFLFSNHALGDDFGYDGKHGPEHWGDDYKTCLGKYQSPIDIEDKDVRTASFPPLRFSNVQDPHPAYMTNNGHTVMIRSTDSDSKNVPTASGGPLNDTYVFQQLHFHWGENDDEGSEDLINNHSFSMELHAVFWKQSYGSLSNAMKYRDGLAVLAFLYQATDEPNPNFEAIVSQLPEIATVNSNVTIKDDNILNKLIAPNGAASQDYYTYIGSLTTPPCLEVVQWIDFIKPQNISHEQVSSNLNRVKTFHLATVRSRRSLDIEIHRDKRMNGESSNIRRFFVESIEKKLAAFRSIKSNDGSNLTHNYRPVQPLDNRTIYRNINNDSTEAAKPEVGSSSPIEAAKPAVGSSSPTEVAKPAGGSSSSTELTSASTTKQMSSVPTTVKPSPSTHNTNSPSAPKPTIASKTTVGKPTTDTSPKESDTDAPGTMKSGKTENGHHSGQEGIWNASTAVLVFGISFLLPWQRYAGSL